MTDTTSTRRSHRRTVPTQLAALASGVTEATIRKWASRGKLTRYGRPGRAEYDLEELLHMAATRTPTPETNRPDPTLR